MQWKEINHLSATAYDHLDHSITDHLAVLENQMPHRRVRRGHVIEAMDLFDLGIERAAHDEPHDELDAFRAGFAHVVDVRHFGELVGFIHDAIEKAVVEFFVDETCARTLQLMAHAAGAPDLHVQIFVERIDGAADRLAELITAIAGRRRVLHDVHCKRNDLARPRLRLAEHQRQRHGEPMIDIHAIDEREIEIVLDHVTARCARPVPDDLARRAPAADPSLRRQACIRRRSRSRTSE